ncbi:hypothetical protein C7443_103311 [Plasticicumulans acidivorans]|uniref:Uncharacterized protein n=1 Tax=Plasticicumulans acidivorans TaxID=886464 RepID=A0A317MWW6_9GAMM|nr:hypothetical protein C7443_103311 [Plasticicumulans acidivorans]
MNHDWASFLSEYRQSSPTATLCGADGIRALSGPGILCAAESWSLAQAHGRDAIAFLQGQLTQDVRRIDRSTSLPAAYCSPKGRVLSTLRLFLHHEDVGLILPAERRTAVLERLSKFILRADVHLSPTDDRVTFGCAGSEAAGILASVLGIDLPETPNHASSTPDTTVLRLPAPVARFIVITTSERAKPLWLGCIEAGLQVTDDDTWRWLDIAAGAAEIGPTGVETYTPQMLNLQLTDAVSFTKGCYTGQEVVARTQYLGEVKRRLYRAHIDDTRRPQADVALWAPGETEAEQTIGRLLTVSPHPDGGFAALAVVQVHATAAAEVRLQDENGPIVTLESLTPDLEEED